MGGIDAAAPAFAGLCGSIGVYLGLRSLGGGLGGGVERGAKHSGEGLKGLASETINPR